MELVEELIGQTRACRVNVLDIRQQILKDPFATFCLSILGQMVIVILVGWAIGHACALLHESLTTISLLREYLMSILKKIRTSNSTPVMIRFEGDNFTTLDHIHPLDDALCAVNGFWDYPVDPVLHDFEYLTNVSRQYCKRLEAEVPHFHNLTMRQFLDEEMDDDRSFDALVNSGYQSSGVIPSLKSNMLLHEAVKCLLGGVECDIANCVRRACKDGANVLKYGSDCS